MTEPNLVGVPQTDRGPWMQTWLGGRFYPLDPRPEDIDPRDIARGLSFQNRYCGHTITPFTIAQHSVMAADYAMTTLEDPELAQIMLLHDATEAYLGDMPRPLKAVVPEYREIEERTWRAIATRFWLPLAMPAAVKEVDNHMLAIEKVHLAPNAEAWPGIPDMPVAASFIAWSPEFALNKFIARFTQLFPGDPVFRAPH